MHGSAEIENSNINDDEELQSFPDWLKEFKHGLVDESVPGHRDTSSSSREQVVPSKHNFVTHLPKDWNCDICLRTKITRLLAEDAPVQSCPEQNILVT